jgi:hypothetical protein
MDRAVYPGVGQDKVFYYGAIALAAGAAFVWGGEANAALVTQTYDLDLYSSSTLRIGDGSPSGVAQFATAYVISGGAGAQVVGTSASPHKVSDLAVGDTIGPSSGFVAEGYLSSALKSQIDGGLGTTGTDYLGLQFSIDQGTPLFGYATVNGADLVAVTYDTTGSPVTIASAVPEPASLGLLAFGAAGIATIRRRRALMA